MWKLNKMGDAAYISGGDIIGIYHPYIVIKRERQCGGHDYILGEFNTLEQAQQCLKDYVDRQNAQEKEHELLQQS